MTLGSVQLGTIQLLATCAVMAYIAAKFFSLLGRIVTPSISQSVANSAAGVICCGDCAGSRRLPCMDGQAALRAQ